LNGSQWRLLGYPALTASLSVGIVYLIFIRGSKDEKMLDQLSHLQDQILGAPPEVVVPTGIFLFLVLIRLVLALPDPSPVAAQRRLEAEARRWIADRIDEHVDVLAEAYGEAGMRGEQDDLPRGFVLTVESFIAEVLMRALDAKDFDGDLRAAVREFAVLHRAEIYEDVTTRTRKYLAAA